jgi:UDP-N-acetylglucosamine 4,6-dehydratase/5-epimerase
MTPSALALAEALSQDALPMGAVSSVPMRDFSQPWLDLNDKSVLVTGGTGSFGKHFLKTVIAQYKPRRLIIFSRDELKQFEMQQEFSQKNIPSCAISSVMCATVTAWTWRCAMWTMSSMPPP